MAFVSPAVRCLLILAAWSGSLSRGYAESSAFPQHLSLIAGCRILNPGAKDLRVLPGERCLFRDNGDFISAGAKELRYITAGGEIKWVLTGVFHHQMSWSQNRQEILVLASEVVVWQDKDRRRFDKLLVVDLTGKVLKQLDFVTVLRQHKLKPLKFANTVEPQEGVPYEGTHLNSFYEIPALPAHPERAAYWKAGNYVVNGLMHGYFVLDAKLEKVLWNDVSPTAQMHLVHDVQVLPSGRLIQFVNLRVTATEDLRASAVEEIDLVTFRPVHVAGTEAGGIFYSRFGGGVQNLDDDLLLFSTSFTGAYLYSRKAKALVWSSIFFHMRDSEAPIYIQRLGAQDLREYFKNSTPKPAPR